MADEGLSTKRSDVFARCAPYARLVHDFVTTRHHVQHRRVINDHALLYFHGGRGYCHADGLDVAIRPGLILVIPPGAWHSFAGPDGGAAAYHMFNIHFDPVQRADSRRLRLHFDQQVPRRLDPGDSDILPGPQPRRVQAFELGDRAGYARVFQAALAHFPAEDRTGALHLRAAMIELLAWLHAAIDHGAGAGTGGGGGVKDAGQVGANAAALVRARALIRTRYAEPWRLESLAAQVGLGRTTLAVEFRRRFGLAPIAYLRRIRIEHAKVLLAAEGVAPKAVAARVGFASVHHFTRAFTAMVGVPPAGYMRGAGRGADRDRAGPSANEMAKGTNRRAKIPRESS
jgi:AraC-like DNA-binding protein